MQYNFDEIIDRTGTSCVKWDFVEQFLEAKDVLSMWVADMDFRTPDFITDAVKKRADHEIFGLGGEGFQRMNVACPRSIVEEAMQ